MELKDVATYINGYAFKPEDWSDKGTLIIRIQNLTNSFNSNNYFEGKLDDKYLIKKGDVLISWSATLGVFEWNGNDGYLNQHIFKVVFNKIDINKKYFIYMIKSKLEEMKKNVHGSTMTHITKNNFDRIKCNIPTMNKQQEIVSILDKINAIIDADKKQLELLDETVKSRFIEMFEGKDYPIKSLSEIAKYWNGLTYKPSDVVEEGTGTLVLRSSNIQNGSLAFDDNVYVNCKIKEKQYVKENDILMCSRNGSARLVGKVALIKGLEAPTSFGAFMMIIRSDYYPYLKVFFEMPSFRNQLATGTSTINQITGNMLNGINIPVPNLDEVKEFQLFVEQIDKSKFTLQKEIELYQELLEKKMDEYFN